MKVWLTNRLVDAKDARVSVFDHGFLYGDGIYETVRAYHYEIFHWPDHYKRLKQSAKRIELKCPWSKTYLLNAIKWVLKANRQPNASVRITISRGPGALGLDPALCPTPTLAMILHPERPLEKLWKTGVSIGIPNIRRNHPECLDPQIKSNNSLNTILAKIEAKRMKVFEAVLLNLDDYLTEGTISNIFFTKGRALFTPALTCGLLEGVTRAGVIRLARRLSYPIREGRYTLKDLRTADEIFLTSTTLEMVSVTKVISSLSRDHAATIWSGRPGPIVRNLHAHFRRLL